MKGLYKAALAGTIKQFTGISDPFEIPTRAHNIHEQSLDTANQEVWDLVPAAVTKSEAAGMASG